MVPVPTSQNYIVPSRNDTQLALILASVMYVSTYFGLCASCTRTFSFSLPERSVSIPQIPKCAGETNCVFSPEA